MYRTVHVDYVSEYILSYVRVHDYSLATSYSYMHECDRLAYDIMHDIVYSFMYACIYM